MKLDSELSEDFSSYAVPMHQNLNIGVNIPKRILCSSKQNSQSNTCLHMAFQAHKLSSARPGTKPDTTRSLHTPRYLTTDTLERIRMRVRKEHCNTWAREQRFSNISTEYFFNLQQFTTLILTGHLVKSLYQLN